MDIGRIRAAAKDAAEGWTGWQWPHDPAGAGIVTDGPGAVEDWDAWEKERAKDALDRGQAMARLREERGGEDLDEEHYGIEDLREMAEEIAASERGYGEQVEVDAEAAADHGRACVEAAEAGDFEEALVEAERAADLESEYGDSPSYRPLVEAVKAAKAASEMQQRIDACSWFQDRGMHVAVLPGMPEKNVRVGIGATQEEAVGDLDVTLIQSVGPDSGVQSALEWAWNQGWIAEAVDDDGEDRLMRL